MVYAQIGTAHLLELGKVIKTLPLNFYLSFFDMLPMFAPEMAPSHHLKGTPELWTAQATVQAVLSR